MRIMVTGLGMVSALGNDIAENFESLKNKKTGIGAIEILKTVHKDSWVAGEIKHTNAGLTDTLEIEDSLTYPRTTLLGIHAAREAFKNAGLELTDGSRTGIVVGTTVGGMDLSETFYRKPEENPSFIATHSCGFTTEKIADYLGITGTMSTISTACSSGLNAIAYGARLIRHGYIDRAIVGGTDALSLFTLNGFKTLMILDEQLCAPFDKNRKGLNLGEGAGFLVIESEKSLNERKGEAICTLSGWGNANDAFHQTASSPEGNGPYMCMHKALEQAALSPEDIGYINVHGTGTENNDLTEGIALKRIFGEHVPPFSSTKSYTGHTLGAAGGVEAVIAVLTLQHQLCFPNLNFTKAIEELGLVPLTEVQQNPTLKHVMTNSFGFGGNDSSLIFSKL